MGGAATTGAAEAGVEAVGVAAAAEVKSRRFGRRGEKEADDEGGEEAADESFVR